ncbi:hypothetical protein VTP01DRAFT_1817 [Rhizomucor pusillus]|uniref:uncharacterized protein n=1 Tax=Rhizomucor pusillus TaxID=4840 RepID=UPI003743793B
MISTRALRLQLLRNMSTITRPQTNKAPAALGPYSQATKVNGIVYTSGSLGLDPETGAMAQGVQAETRQALTNMGEILKASGSSLDKVLKTTVFLRDMNDFNAVNEVYATFFKELPARSCIQVARLPKDAAVEIECVALADE